MPTNFSHLCAQKNGELNDDYF
uniref:Uncharacterized protein n=1 Tax=Rhizophora mucronata TaxID=61149 RepID=A0A2P2NDG2_RHIMU